VLPARTVKRALARLKKANFVTSSGFVWRDGRHVFPRVVNGDAKSVGGRLQIEMTPEMEAGLLEVPTWGGLRRRKKGQDGPEELTSFEVKTAPKNHQDGPELSGQDGPEEGGQDGPEEGVKTAPIGKDLLGKDSFKELPSKDRKSTLPWYAGKTPAYNFDENSAKEAAQKPGADLPPKSPAVQDQADSPKPKVSAPIPISKINGNGLPRAPERRSMVALGLAAPSPLLARISAIQAGSVRKPVEWGHGGMPWHPDVSVFNYSVRPPPRVPAGASKEDQLEFCVRWYRAALESRGREKRKVNLGQVREHFEDALELFLKHDVRPGAWVAWALDRLLYALPTNARKKFHPEVKRLLSAKTFEESLWKFREDEATYASAAWVLTPAGEELRARMHRLRWAVDALGSQRTEAQVKAMVAQHFPEGFEAACAATKENSRVQGQGIETRIQLGHWVWPVSKSLMRDLDGTKRGSTKARGGKRGRGKKTHRARRSVQFRASV